MSLPVRIDALYHMILALQRKAGVGITLLTGDVTTVPGSGAQPTTLANTAVTPGTYGDASNVGQFTVDAKGRITSATEVAIGAASWTATITATFNGGGAAISAGANCWCRVPVALTITKVTLLADQTGDIVIDIWVDSYANFPPTDDDSITASAPPEISGGVKSEDSTLTGWDTSVAAGAVVWVNVDSCVDIEKCVLVLEGTT